MPLPRRQFLQSALVLASGALVGCEAHYPGAAPPDGGAAPPDLAPTPSCDEETETNTEGPYYTPGAPMRTSLLDSVDGGVDGPRLVLAGRVLTRSGCAPLPGATLDLWQADAAGTYDLTGYRLRGVFAVDDNGGFSIATVLPGRYLNGATYRPRHLHVKVRAPGHETLTTQLYFPDDPYNEADGFFLPSLLVRPEALGIATLARFDFVLA